MLLLGCLAISSSQGRLGSKNFATLLLFSVLASRGERMRLLCFAGVLVATRKLIKNAVDTLPIRDRVYITSPTKRLVSDFSKNLARFHGPPWSRKPPPGS